MNRGSSLLSSTGRPCPGRSSRTPAESPPLPETKTTPASPPGETPAIGWNPAVNVLLPDCHRDDGRIYPVLYLLHGGGPGQDFISWDDAGIRDLSAGKPIIIVMPDGGP